MTFNITCKRNESKTLPFSVGKSYPAEDVGGSLAVTGDDGKTLYITNLNGSLVSFEVEK